MPSDKQIAQEDYDYYQQQLLAVFVEIQQYFTEPPPGYRPLGLPPLGKFADKAINILNDALAAARQPEQGAQLGQMVMLLLQNDFEGARQLALEIPLAFPDGTPAAAPTETAAPQPTPPEGELLPCPFCGVTPLVDWTVVQPVGSKGAMHSGHMADCFFSKFLGARSFAGAVIREWNARALPAAPTDELRKKLNEIEEREAAVCPEDFGFDEYIRILTRQRDELRETLRELAASGVEFDDERLNYVVMQIDRNDLERARKLIETN